MFNHPNRIFGLDVLRAIAISMVVISHCTFLLPQNDSQIIIIIRTFGAIGVDLFFVLSGYLIGGILLKHINKSEIAFRNLFEFWKRRWLRTIPNYIVVLALNSLLFYYLNGYFFPDSWRYFMFFQNFNFSHPDFFTEAWSLSIEEFAYLTLPLFIFCSFSVFRTGNKARLFFYSSIVSLTVLLVFKIQFYVGANILDYKDWSSGFRKVVIYRLDSIYFGFILVYLITKYKNLFGRIKKQLLVLGLLLFIGLHFYIYANGAMPQSHLFFYCFIYLTGLVLSISLCFPFFTTLSKPKYGKGIVYFLSTRSYSIYLINYSIILLTLTRYFEPSISLIMIYLVGTILGSELLYKLIEKPFLRLREHHLPRD